MFRALLCPSSGAQDYNFDYHIGRFVLGFLYVRIIIKYLKIFKLLQHVSDHKGSIIRELYTVLG